MTDGTLSISSAEFHNMVAHLDTAIAEGRYAYRVGKELISNPYDVNSPYHDSWLNGWNMACGERVMAGYAEADKEKETKGG